MNPPDHVQFGLQIAAAFSPLFITVLWWLGRRGLDRLMERLDAIDKTLALHENRLTEGNGEFRSLREQLEALRKRVDQLEERERDRCFNGCRYKG